MRTSQENAHNRQILTKFLQHLEHILTNYIYCNMWSTPPPTPSTSNPSPVFIPSEHTPPPLPSSLTLSLSPSKITNNFPQLLYPPWNWWKTSLYVVCFKTKVETSPLSVGSLQYFFLLYSSPEPILMNEKQKKNIEGMGRVEGWWGQCTCICSFKSLL